jgi:hypothetical protein
MTKEVRNDEGNTSNGAWTKGILWRNDEQDTRNGWLNGVIEGWWSETTNFLTKIIVGLVQITLNHE